MEVELEEDDEEDPVQERDAVIETRSRLLGGAGEFISSISI